MKSQAYVFLDDCKLKWLGSVSDGKAGLLDALLLHSKGRWGMIPKELYQGKGYVAVEGWQDGDCRNGFVELIIVGRFDIHKAEEIRKKIWPLDSEDEDND